MRYIWEQVRARVQTNRTGRTVTKGLVTKGMVTNRTGRTVRPSTPQNNRAAKKAKARARAGGATADTRSAPVLAAPTNAGGGQVRSVYLRNVYVTWGCAVPVYVYPHSVYVTWGCTVSAYAMYGVKYIHPVVLSHPPATTPGAAHQTRLLPGGNTNAAAANAGPWAGAGYFPPHRCATIL